MDKEEILNLFTILKNEIEHKKANYSFICEKTGGCNNCTFDGWDICPLDLEKYKEVV